jgi:unsaturated rhamnogalacturonyl hydrolase
MKTKLCICLFTHLLLHSAFHPVRGNPDDFDPRWSVRLAETAMSNNFYFNVMDYVAATAIKGFRNLWLFIGDSSYLQYIGELVDASLEYHYDMAGSDYHDIDPVNGGSLVLFMSSKTGESKYRSAADSILKFLKAFPRSADGGLFHKDIPRMQVDDLYMGSPFLAEYGDVFNKPEEYTDAARQAILMEKHTRDTATGLYYHVWYETDWQDHKAGCTPIFWGRGVGWVAMALVDMLDFMPVEYSGRDSVIAVFQRLAGAIIQVQDSTTGVWWQVLDQKRREGNFPESSASGMFVYALAKGIRMGYIDESYWPVVEKGYKGILKELIRVNEDSSVTITGVCPGQSPGDYYDNYAWRSGYENGHAFGPFIKASVEIELRGILPTELQASVISGARVNLRWNDNSGDEEGFIIERAADGNFEEVIVLPPDTESYQDSTLLPLTAYTYRIRSYKGNVFSLYSDQCYAITMAENGAPAFASQPGPADGTKSVSQAPVISWLPGTASASHDIYFGTSDPPPFLQNQADPVFSPDTLEPYTTYYWQVNEVNSSGTTAGTIWCFTTGGKPGIVAHWNMDEESGSVLHDVSGYGNNGTLINMNDESWVAGIFGNALQFDGNDDYIMVPHHPSIDFLDQDFSISFWLKQTVEDRSMTYIIKGTHGSPGTGKRYEVVFDTSINFIRFTIDDNVATPSDMFLQPDIQLDTAKWNHIAVRRNTANNSLYVFVNTQIIGFAVDNLGDISQEEDLYIAVSPDEQNTNFEGLLDDIRIYNYDFGIDEMEAIYNEGITSIEDNKTPSAWRPDIEYYPNPVKGKTNIFYSLIRKEKVKITVYDLFGREIAILADKVLPEGKYSAEFDASGLISGTYICRLQTNSGIQTIKILCVK